MMDKGQLLESIKGGLIVSCQAQKGSPMYGTDIMVAFAAAAKQGGAVGIRATEPQNIRAIKQAVHLPIIGIYKQWHQGYEVYITPTFESAKAIIESGADIIALDGTKRPRPDHQDLQEIILNIHTKFPDVPVMADCDNLESGRYAENCGADIVSTTLSGYTENTKGADKINFQLIRDMHDTLNVPIIAEGHIVDIRDAVNAYKSGAFSIVIGSAITRPEFITGNFVQAIHEYRH